MKTRNNAFLLLSLVSVSLLAEHGNAVVTTAAVETPVEDDVMDNTATETVVAEEATASEDPVVEEAVTTEAAAEKEDSEEAVVEDIATEPVGVEAADEDGEVVDLDATTVSEKVEEEASINNESTIQEPADTATSVEDATNTETAETEATAESVETQTVAVEQNDDAQPSETTKPQSETTDIDTATTATEKESAAPQNNETPQQQSGPFVDIFGPSLLSLEMIDEKHAQLKSHPTNDALKGKKVVGLYFSADWCGPCQKFTPELVSFYEKMNARRGRENQFEIVWISRSRDYDKWGQFFGHMPWLAMTPEEAMGQKGALLSEQYKVKGIPHLVLVDADSGDVITYDARTKIPADRAGIGFPWRNPLVTAYTALFPKALRLMIRTGLLDFRKKVVLVAKGAFGVGMKKVKKAAGAAATV